MAARVAERPAAIVSDVFDVPAERQGAYDFVENERIAAEQLAAAAVRAAAYRARDEPIAVVAVDSSSFTLRDPNDQRSVGRVGSLTGGARGLQVMDALVLSEEGVALGVGGTCFWAREAVAKNRSHKRVPPEQRESRFWNEVRNKTRAEFASIAPDTRLWFVHDRGSDCWPVIVDAVDHRENEYTTIRAAWDRRAFRGHRERKEVTFTHNERLWAVLNRSPVKGHFSLQLDANTGRQRTVVIDVRACAVTLDLLPLPKQSHLRTPVWAVYARQRGTPPKDEKPIEWMLLTTYPVHTFEDARRVIEIYGLRWDVEALHAMWKGGGSDVEQTQLKDRTHIERWMMIHASVAARILRLTNLARLHPDRPADEEFDPYEIEAARALYARHRKPMPERPTIAEFVNIMAALAGASRYDGTPPGPRVLARALQRIDIVAMAFRARDPPQRPPTKK